MIDQPNEPGTETQPQHDLSNALDYDDENTQGADMGDDGWEDIPNQESEFYNPDTVSDEQFAAEVHKAAEISQQADVEPGAGLMGEDNTDDGYDQAAATSDEPEPPAEKTERELMQATGYTQLQKAVQNAVKDIEKLDQDSDATNQARQAIRETLAAQGIPKKAFDMGCAIAKMDESQVEAIDAAYKVVRAAIGKPVQGDLFKELVVVTPEVITAVLEQIKAHPDTVPEGYKVIVSEVKPKAASGKKSKKKTAKTK